jgi:hypothetical protein
MRTKVKVERRNGLVSTFLRGPSIEIWIGLFIGIIAFYLSCPFRVVVLSFGILSRKFETKFPKNFQANRTFREPGPDRRHQLHEWSRI